MSGFIEFSVDKAYDIRRDKHLVRLNVLVHSPAAIHHVTIASGTDARAVALALRSMADRLHPEPSVTP